MTGGGRGIALAGVVMVLALGGVLLAVAVVAALGAHRTGAAWIESVRLEAAAWNAVTWRATRPLEPLPPTGDTAAVSVVPLGDALAEIAAEAVAGDGAWNAVLLVRPRLDSTGLIAYAPVSARARATPRP